MAELGSNIAAVIDALRARREAWLARPIKAHLDDLASLAVLWREDSPWHARAVALPAEPFGRATVLAALKALGRALTRKNLERAVRLELGLDPESAFDWSPQEPGIALAVVPLGVVTHILPGNTFMTGILAALQCLITRNSAVLKLPRNDAGFLTLFLEAVRGSGAAHLAEHLHVLSTEAATPKTVETLKRESDGLVIWGGAEAIAAFPPAECAGRVVSFGPRVGIGVVARAPTATTVDGLAWDVALWEQMACSSPRLIFVRDFAALTASRAFAAALDASLTAVAGCALTSARTLDERSEIASIRERARWTEGQSVVTSSPVASHTVIWSAQLPANVAAGLRTVYVIPYVDRAALRELLQPLRPFLQTAIIDTTPTEDRELVDELVSCGVSQLFMPGSGLTGEFGFPHEGEFLLRRLTRIVGFGAAPSVFGRTS